MDLEPDSSSVLSDHLRLTNITFKNCTATNNTGAGFAGYFAGLLGAKGSWARGVPPTTIRFDNCSVSGGRSSGWSWGALLPNLAGEVVISGGATQGVMGWGVHVSNKAWSSLPIRYEDHRFEVSELSLFKCPQLEYLSAGLQLPIVLKYATINGPRRTSPQDQQKLRVRLR